MKKGEYNKKKDEFDGKKNFIEYHLPIKPVFMRKEFYDFTQKKVKQYEENLKIFKEKEKDEKFFKEFYGKWIGLWKDIKTKKTVIKSFDDARALDYFTPDTAIRTRVGFKKGKKEYNINQFKASLSRKTYMYEVKVDLDLFVFDFTGKNNFKLKGRKLIHK